MKMESSPVNQKKRCPRILAWAGIGLALVLMLQGVRVHAFSLIGPFADWMNPTNGYRLPGDIGGPVDLGQEFRWSVPVLTYAFEGGYSDESFVNYFGLAGMQAVDQAIAILNSLPPASQINLDDFPTSAVQVNYRAQDQRLLDLKSQTLALLLEQLGLASPTRNLACLRSFSIRDGTVSGLVIGRNFDPATLLISSNVNGTLYGYNLGLTSTGAEALEYPVDPLAPPSIAVADGNLQPGAYYTGLTRDDVGGLRYLLLSNNFNLEPLLPDVHGIGTNADTFATTVVRGGVEKISFVRPDYYQGVGPHQFFTPFTNQFTDTYVTNGRVMSQQLERVSLQPDIIFASAALDDGSAAIVRVARTGTTNWVSSGLEASGPGIIRPQIRIVFNRRIGPLLRTSDSRPEGAAVVSDYLWGSFDGSTNAPMIFPGGIPVDNTNKTVVRLWLIGPGLEFLAPNSWELPVPLGGTVTPETSTNLIDWVRLPAMTNRGVAIDWDHWVSRPMRFFRILAE